MLEVDSGDRHRPGTVSPPPVPDTPSATEDRRIDEAELAASPVWAREDAWHADQNRFEAYLDRMGGS